CPAPRYQSGKRGARAHHSHSPRDGGRYFRCSGRGSPAWTETDHTAVQDAETGHIPPGLSELGRRGFGTHAERQSRQHFLGIPLVVVTRVVRHIAGFPALATNLQKVYLHAPN